MTQIITSKNEGCQSESYREIPGRLNQNIVLQSKCWCRRQLFKNSKYAFLTIPKLLLVLYFPSMFSNFFIFSN